MEIFIGFDPRQPLAYTVCRSSIERHTRGRVKIEPLILERLPMKRRGLTEFTFTRYMVPCLCNYQGSALFLDADIILRDDVLKLYDVVGSFAETFRRDDLPSVSVVKNPKLRFEWPSVMYFNTWLCKSLTPEYIETGAPQSLEWASKIGELPKEWNHCVGYDEQNPSAKIVHFTQGIPCWPETKDCEFSKEWRDEFKYAVGTVSWAELMGNSVHAGPVMQRLA